MWNPGGLSMYPSQSLDLPKHIEGFGILCNQVSFNKTIKKSIRILCTNPLYDDMLYKKLISKY